MKTFRIFKITAEPFIPEIISGVLWELEAEGIVEQNDHLQLFVKDESKVTTEDVEMILNSLIEQELIDKFNIEVSSIKDKNWNEEWEKQLDVIEISDTLVIKPSVKEYHPKDGQIVITIDPKMSFGFLKR